jgi:hypothetical protein
VQSSRISKVMIEWRGDTDTNPVAPEWTEHLTVQLAGGAGEARFDEAPDEFPKGCQYEWDEMLALADQHLADEPASEKLVLEHWDRARRLVAENEQAWTAFAAALIAEQVLGERRCAELLAAVKRA